MLFMANVTSAQVMDKLIGNGYDESIGILVTPLLNVDIFQVVYTGLPWAVDNGAFSEFDECKFRRLLTAVKHRPNLRFIVCPDVVGNAADTIALFKKWEGEVLCSGPSAFVLQDGQEDLELPDADSYFVGGSTKFKLSAAVTDLIVECRRRGRWVHMGRVNTKIRVKHAHVRGVNSIDGTLQRYAGINGLRHLIEYVAMLSTIDRVRNIGVGQCQGVTTSSVSYMDLNDSFG